MLWGKAPYESRAASPRTSNVAPFDDFPGPGDIDANGDGFFNTDRSNGGIAGIVHYSDHPRGERPAVGRGRELGARRQRRADPALGREPHAPAERGARPTTGTTPCPTGCQWPRRPSAFVYQGRPTDCFDGLRNFNQARPALFDGGYAFSTILADARAGDHRAADLQPADRLSAGDGAAAPGRQVRGQDDRAARLQGAEGRRQERRLRRPYVPQQFWLSGYPLADRRRRRALATLAAARQPPRRPTITRCAAARVRSIHPNDQ